jgi:glycosyltransferase involved in cell wall biosynthesis
MKIGIEAQRLFRTKKHGMDIVVLELLRNLQQIDHDNEYVIFLYPDKDRCLDSSNRFKICELKNSFYPYWEQVLLPRAAAREQLDLLHCTSNTAPLRTAMPLVLTLHDIIYLEKTQAGSGSMTTYQKLGQTYRRLIVPRIIPRCDRIITVSQFECQRIEKQLALPANKLLAVYNGVSSLFKPVSDLSALRQVRQAYGLPERFILFLGNTDPKKNVGNVLAAYASYVKSASPIWPLVITDYSSERLEAMLQANGLPDLRQHILLPGYIPQNQLAIVYALAQIFLYPSLRESFGLPILEAMASGTPVITSNTSSMPEVAGEAALLIDPTKPEELSKAMLTLQNDPESRQKMAIQGLARTGLFTWRTMAEKVLRIYESVYQQHHS